MYKNRILAFEVPYTILHVFLFSEWTEEIGDFDPLLYKK